MSTQDQRISAFVKVMPKHLASKRRTSWGTVAKDLNHTGVSDGKGIPWERETAQNFYKNYKEQIEALVSGSKDSNEIATETTSSTSKEPPQIAKPHAQVETETSSKDSNGAATAITSKTSKRGAIPKTQTQGGQTEHDGRTEPLSTDSRDVATAREEQVMEEIVKSYESGELKELIEWWNAKKAAPLHRSHVPLFRKDLEYKITGIRVKKEIAKRASEKLEDPEIRASYGSSMSNLIEILLWEFIGKDRDLLAGDSHD